MLLFRFLFLFLFLFLHLLLFLFLFLHLLLRARLRLRLRLLLRVRLLCGERDSLHCFKYFNSVATGALHLFDLSCPSMNCIMSTRPVPRRAALLVTEVHVTFGSYARDNSTIVPIISSNT